MLIDNQLSFTNGALSLVGADGVAIPAPNVIDLLGFGVGVTPNSIFGNTTVYGSADAKGVGHMRPELNVTLGTLPTTSNAATLNVALQGAIDNGSAQPGTWNTFVESGAITVANMAANLVIFRCPWVPPFPANLRPRFLRLLFSPATSTHFTAGTVNALVTLVRDDQFNKYAAKNYAV